MTPERGKHKQRHRIRICLSDARVGVLDARAFLHRANADSPAAGEPAEAVGDVDHHSFGSSHDRLDPNFGARVDHRVRRKAAQKFNALILQDLRDRRLGLHRGYLRLVAFKKPCRRPHPEAAAT
jgi:hypothetical protein